MTSRWKARELGNCTGKAVQIVGTTAGVLQLRKHSLEEIINQLPPNTYLAILSIGGEYRTGKSFFLNFLRFYLLNQSLPAGGELEKMCGFTWRTGEDACTKGIWAWSNIFILEKNGSKPFGLLLVDTEGTEDVNQTFSNDALIFSLSTLISSYFIINIPRQIIKSTLGNLKIFTDIASRSQQRGITSSTPFQHLMVLVRDWNFQTSHAFGLASNDFMAKYGLLCPTQSSPTASNTQIKDAAKCYRAITGFLMPHPGGRVTNLSPINDNHQTNLAHSFENQEKIFFENMKKLAEVILNSIDVKAFDTKEPLKPSLLVELIEMFISKQNDHGVMSHPEALFAINKANALTHATKEYEEKMNKKWEEIKWRQGCSYIIEMNGFHDKLKAQLLDRLSDPTRYGGFLEDGDGKLRQELETEIATVFTKLCVIIQAHEHAKREREAREDVERRAREVAAMVSFLNENAKHEREAREAAERRAREAEERKRHAERIAREAKEGGFFETVGKGIGKVLDIPFRVGGAILSGGGPRDPELDDEPPYHYPAE